MNNNFLRNVALYTAGVATVLLIQNVYQTFEIKEMIFKEESPELTDSGDAAMATGIPCACDDEKRRVDPAADSQNFPISESTCRTLVNDLGAGAAVKGAWFSKVTLDNMFCRNDSANGIFVYPAFEKAKNSIVYVVEAGRTNMTLSTDDGHSYIYGSRSLCPMICGVYASAPPH